ncbi:hypothetical protein CDAR_485401 [Caerostris darwini]|uniref:Uncharacterized protein n=1 Tax=Caerostris darwini TaxID=1538125 RepID=A0AAV4PA92_9ARAC|nr:hypothetical protein CDAR_485401 [Caerostris darwini]
MESHQTVAEGREGGVNSKSFRTSERRNAPNLVIQDEPLLALKMTLFRSKDLVMSLKLLRILGKVAVLQTGLITCNKLSMILPQQARLSDSSEALKNPWKDCCSSILCLITCSMGR